MVEVHKRLRQEEKIPRSPERSTDKDPAKSSSPIRPPNVVALQRWVGNQGVQRLLNNRESSTRTKAVDRQVGLPPLRGVALSDTLQRDAKQSTTRAQKQSKQDDDLDKDFEILVKLADKYAYYSKNWVDLDCFDCPQILRQALYEHGMKMVRELTFGGRYNNTCEPKLQRLGKGVLELFWLYLKDNNSSVKEMPRNTWPWLDKVPPWEVVSMFVQLRIAAYSAAEEARKDFEHC